MNYSEEFLRQLDSQKTRTIYARITSLQWNESPIEMITGRVTQGSINIDGASAIRRSCSLTMIAHNININEFYWGFKTKMRLEIGLQNTIDTINFPDIIWFNQGVFVITQFNCAYSTNNFTINLQAKDKMCLLNGEVGGTLTAPTQFDSYEQEDINGNWNIIKYPIKTIIKDAVHQYANEPLNNIIINDVDDLGLELLEYRYDEPLYLFREQHDDTFYNGTFDKNMECWLESGFKTTISDSNLIQYDLLTATLNDLDDSTVVYLEPNGKPTCIAKIEYGNTAGYRTTDLIYPSDLIMGVGSSLTQMLDKLVALLGEYEYFYDLDGFFRFQKKQNYVDTIWTPVVENEDEGIYVEGTEYSTSNTYLFTAGQLINTFNNSPNLNNLRNDFSVWGQRTNSSTGANIPVHIRYAIDQKPIYYKNFAGQIFIWGTDIVTAAGAIKCDWREIIYQMQADYKKHNHDDDFSIRIAINNQGYYDNGFTGYEQYYIDIEGFWRQLYYPDWAYEEDIIKLNNKIAEQEKLLALGGLTSVEIGRINSKITSLKKEITDLSDQRLESFYPATAGQKAYWSKEVFENPEALNFWIDFLDQDGELQQFSAKMVGNRPKAVNDTNVKSIYFRETPTIIFTSASGRNVEKTQTGYRYFQVDNLENMFSISAQGKSGKDAIDELLYNHSYAIENVTISSVPIYYLEPNTRIYVHDDTSGIDGEYIISKMSIPLTYNGMMNITATKAPELLL